MIKYKKITSNADIWDFKNNEILEGKYIGLKEGVGKNNSILYYVEKDGVEFAFWGSTLLDDVMKKVIVNSMIRIKYLGLAKSKSGSEYNNFEVSVGEIEEE